MAENMIPSYIRELQFSHSSGTLLAQHARCMQKIQVQIANRPSYATSRIKCRIRRLKRVLLLTFLHPLPYAFNHQCTRGCGLLNKLRRCSRQLRNCFHRMTTKCSPRTRIWLAVPSYASVALRNGYVTIMCEIRDGCINVVVRNYSACELIMQHLQLPFMKNVAAIVIIPESTWMHRLFGCVATVSARMRIPSNRIGGEKHLHVGLCITCVK